MNLLVADSDIAKKNRITQFYHSSIADELRCAKNKRKQEGNSGGNLRKNATSKSLTFSVCFILWKERVGKKCRPMLVMSE